MADWYQTYVVGTGRSAALWALIGFLVTYGLTRWITRRIRARGTGQARQGRSAVRDVYIGSIFTIICLLKGKLITGLVGLPVPLLALVGAVRLAKPSSFWARRWYSGRKMAKANGRFGPRYQARRERLRDLFSGGRRPEAGDQPSPARIGPGETAEGTNFCCLEALQNTAKYARASQARIMLQAQNGTLCFTASDDGAGCDARHTPMGSGLRNMADRLAALGGRLEIRSAPGQGTTIIGHLPVPATSGGDPRPTITAGRDAAGGLLPRHPGRVAQRTYVS